MKPRMGIIGGFLLQPRHFLSNKSNILKDNWLVVWLFWPKTDVCVVVDRDYSTYFKANIGWLGRLNK